MWTEPYLETCCRSALHRLSLSGTAGRPPGLKDGPCLERLAGMGLVRARADGRYELTAAGIARHAGEVLHAQGNGGKEARPGGSAPRTPAKGREAPGPHSV